MRGRSSTAAPREPIGSRRRLWARPQETATQEQGYVAFGPGYGTERACAAGISPGAGAVLPAGGLRRRGGVLANACRLTPAPPTLGHPITTPYYSAHTCNVEEACRQGDGGQGRVRRRGGSTQQTSSASAGAGAGAGAGGPADSFSRPHRSWWPPPPAPCRFPPCESPSHGGRWLGPRREPCLRWRCEGARRGVLHRGAACWSDLDSQRSR